MYNARINEWSVNSNRSNVPYTQFHQPHCSCSKNLNFKYYQPQFNNIQRTRNNLLGQAYLQSENFLNEELKKYDLNSAKTPKFSQLESPFYTNTVHQAHANKNAGPTKNSKSVSKNYVDDLKNELKKEKNNIPRLPKKCKDLYVQTLKHELLLNKLTSERGSTSPEKNKGKNTTTKHQKSKPKTQPEKEKKKKKHHSKDKKKRSSSREPKGASGPKETKTSNVQKPKPADKINKRAHSKSPGRKKPETKTPRVQKPQRTDPDNIEAPPKSPEPSDEDNTEVSLEKEDPETEPLSVQKPEPIEPVTIEVTPKCCEKQIIEIKTSDVQKPEPTNPTDEINSKVCCRSLEKEIVSVDDVKNDTCSICTQCKTEPLDKDKKDSIHSEMAKSLDIIEDLIPKISSIIIESEKKLQEIALTSNKLKEEVNEKEQCIASCQKPLCQQELNVKIPVSEQKEDAIIAGRNGEIESESATSKCLPCQTETVKLRGPLQISAFRILMKNIENIKDEKFLQEMCLSELLKNKDEIEDCIECVNTAEKCRKINKNYCEKDTSYSVLKTDNAQADNQLINTINIDVDPSINKPSQNNEKYNLKEAELARAYLNKWLDILWDEMIRPQAVDSDTFVPCSDITEKCSKCNMEEQMHELLKSIREDINIEIQETNPCLKIQKMPIIDIRNSLQFQNTLKIDIPPYSTPKSSCKSNIAYETVIAGHNLQSTIIMQNEGNNELIDRTTTPIKALTSEKCPLPTPCQHNMFNNCLGITKLSKMLQNEYSSCKSPSELGFRSNFATQCDSDASLNIDFLIPSDIDARNLKRNSTHTQTILDREDGCLFGFREYLIRKIRDNPLEHSKLDVVMKKDLENKEYQREINQKDKPSSIASKSLEPKRRTSKNSTSNINSISRSGTETNNTKSTDKSSLLQLENDSIQSSDPNQSSPESPNMNNSNKPGSKYRMKRCSLSLASEPQININRSEGEVLYKSLITIDEAPERKNPTDKHPSDTQEEESENINQEKTLENTSGSKDSDISFEKEISKDSQSLSVPTKESPYSIQVTEMLASAQQNEENEISLKDMKKSSSDEDNSPPRVEPELSEPVEPTATEIFADDEKKIENETKSELSEPVEPTTNEIFVDDEEKIKNETTIIDHTQETDKDKLVEHETMLETAHLSKEEIIGHDEKKISVNDQLVNENTAEDIENTRKQSENVEENRNSIREDVDKNVENKVSSQDAILRKVVPESENITQESLESNQRDKNSMEEGNDNKIIIMSHPEEQENANERMSLPKEETNVHLMTAKESDRLTIGSIPEVLSREANENLLSPTHAQDEIALPPDEKNIDIQEDDGNTERATGQNAFNQPAGTGKPHVTTVLSVFPPTYTIKINADKDSRKTILSSDVLKSCPIFLKSTKSFKKYKPSRNSFDSSETIESLQPQFEEDNRPITNKNMLTPLQTNRTSIENQQPATIPKKPHVSKYFEERECYSKKCAVALTSLDSVGNLSSESELGSTCSSNLSVGEIRQCPYKKYYDVKKPFPGIHYQDKLSSHLMLEKERKRYNNWVTYYSTSKEKKSCASSSTSENDKKKR